MSNILTLTLSDKTRSALQAEADAQHLLLQDHIVQVLDRRVAHPTWPDVAEANELAAQVEELRGERDRARTHAANQEAHAAHQEDRTRATRALVLNAIDEGQVVPSLAFMTAFEQLDAAPDGNES